MKIHVVFSTDDNYVPQMGVAIASILSNADADDELCFHVLTENLSEESVKRISLLKSIRDFELQIATVDGKTRSLMSAVDSTARKEGVNAQRKNDPITLPTYFRLFIGSLLKDLEKVLYLDCDLVVTGSLRELWITDLSRHTIAAVEEPIANFVDADLDIPHYFNSGVMLINLERWRSQDYESKCLNIGERVIEKTGAFDQSILNVVFRDDDVAFLGVQFNYIVGMEIHIDARHFTNNNRCDPVIIHYAGSSKPWSLGFINSYARLYWRYRMMTPWSSEFLGSDVHIKDILKYLTRHPKDAWCVLKEFITMRKGLWKE